MNLRILLAAALCAAAAHAAVDPKNFDLSVKPEVDFFQFANGTWLKNAKIPQDHSSWGCTDELEDRNQTILHRIAEKAAAETNPGFVEKLVGDFYYSGMDLATVDRLGAAPLKPEVDRIESLGSSGDLAAEVAHLHLLGVGVCFAFGSEPDPKNSSMVIAGQGQGGLGLPNKDYYLKDDEASTKLRDQYRAHVAKMLEFSGLAADAAKQGARAVLRLETALAKVSKSDVDLRDPVANYHMLSLSNLQKLSPHFGWEAYFKAIGLEAPSSLDVNQPEFMQGLDRELVATPLSDWKSYLRWHLIHDNAPFLSAAISLENFDFYGRTLTGTPKQRDRWRRVISEIDENAGEALGQLYVATAFPPESKARMLKLVGNVRSALRERIQSLEWMDEPTRAAALGKVDALGVKIGYPDKWIDYSALVIDRGPYVLNVLRANQFNVRLDLAKIGKPVDRLLWGMTPPTVNAYYNPTMNEIVFAAGILQPPLFDAAADDAANYGAIGSIIGHEMTHGFDDEGRQFDKAGNLTDWWTPESAKRFKERSNGIVKQFSAYVAIDELHVNGELTQGENIADLGGLKISYSAFKKCLAGSPGRKIDGFTPEQRFFLSFASAWCQVQRPEALRLQVNTDPHSPVKYRVNGPLSNLDEFAQAFGVPEGAPMRRPPADRVVIW